MIEPNIIADRRGNVNPDAFMVLDALFHGRNRTAYLYRCVWSGMTGL